MSNTGRFPVPVTTAEISTEWLNDAELIGTVQGLRSGSGFRAIRVARDRFCRKALAEERGLGERIFARTVREALDLREIA